MDVNPNDLKESHDASLAALSQQQVGQSNHDVANSYGGQALAAGRGLLNSHDNFNNGLSYGDQATTQAIRSRYQQQYTTGENQLKTSIMKNAQSDHIRSLQVATAAAGQEVEQNKQKAILKWKMDQADKKARGAILGEVLGITAGVVAGVYSGGAGAGAGYAAGNAAGNAIGGS